MRRTASGASSCQRRPTSCNPTGTPATAPAGRLSTGLPVSENGVAPPAIDPDLGFAKGPNLIAVEVYRGALPGSPMQQVLRCATVYVAVDAEDRPRPVDSWSPETPGDMALAEHVRAHINTVRSS